MFIQIEAICDNPQESDHASLATWSSRYRRGPASFPGSLKDMAKNINPMKIAKSAFEALSTTSFPSGQGTSGTPYGNFDAPYGYAGSLFFFVRLGRCVKKIYNLDRVLFIYVFPCQNPFLHLVREDR